jgi:pimeloyl-ACP methyl ester carboxylesterase/GNAT superfamily N-acetyltransferase
MDALCLRPEGAMAVMTCLDSRHRTGVMAHLLGLNADDRWQRFSALASDDCVRLYGAAIAFSRDIVMGALNGAMLVGLGHGAVFVEGGDLVVEIGLSVEAGWRHRGLGRRLLQAVLNLARRWGIVRGYVVYRSDNAGMSTLVRSLGARIDRDGNESTAVCELSASAGVPLVSMWAGRSDTLQVTHPRERGRALLVHGAGGDSYQWIASVIPELFRAGYSVCAPTLPGHGRSGHRRGASLQALADCIATTAEAFGPTVIVGHSLGGYLVQRFLEAGTVTRAVLLASLPPGALPYEDLGHVKAEMRCADGSAVMDAALHGAPSIDVAAVSRASLIVMGGIRDRVVPSRWVQETARRYAVGAAFVDGGHRLMSGRAGQAVAQVIAG